MRSISDQSNPPRLKLPPIDAQLQSTIRELTSAYKKLDSQSSTSNRATAGEKMANPIGDLGMNGQNISTQTSRRNETPRLRNFLLSNDSNTILTSRSQSRRYQLPSKHSFDRSELRTAGSVNRDEVLDLLNWTNDIQAIEDDW